jgi:hypothetical protein
LYNNHIAIMVMPAHTHTIVMVSVQSYNTHDGIMVMPAHTHNGIMVIRRPVELA